MSSFVRIQNRGELPLWGLRLMGLSQKDSSKIGRFGTGLKEAIALCVREGINIIVFSGTCRIEFEARDMDGSGHDEICFRLSAPRGSFAAGEWYGLGLHPNLGHHDWNSPWQVLREFMCNAVDASGTQDLHYDLTSEEPNGVVGATRVYVQRTPGIARAFSQLEQRILFLGERPEAIEVPVAHGRLLTKRGVGSVQIFHRGVWVMEAIGQSPSLYDYEFDALKLNESRSADWYEVQHSIARILATAPVSVAANLLTQILKLGREVYEQRCLITASHFADVQSGVGWVSAFHEVFGRSAVVCPNDLSIFRRALEQGLDPVVVKDPGLMSLLRAVGVRDASHAITLAGTAGVTQEASEASRKKFEAIWRIMVEDGWIGEDSRTPVLRVRTGDKNGPLGDYEHGVCLINAETVGSPMEIAAMVTLLFQHAASGSPTAGHRLMAQALGTAYLEKYAKG